MKEGPFLPAEIALAAVLALALEACLAALLLLASNEQRVMAKEEAVERPLPIRVKPVLDDAPLLKLGGKRVRARLPDMWVKRPPVRREQAASAPSPQAPRTPEAIPTSPLARPDAQAPAPDAAVARRVDEDLPQLDASPDRQSPDLDEKGDPGGVQSGTEEDPLRARAVSQYRMRVIGWFNARFRVPVGEIPCEELKRLSAAVSASVGGDRSVTGYTLTRPSGNAAFDARVRATMDGAVGQQLPPPPPLYPDILDSTVFPTFLGSGQKCE
jgi:hypothetical protein